MYLYKCNECGWVTRADRPGAIGYAHAHAEKHAKVVEWLPQWLQPAPVADPTVLDEFIDTVKVEESTPVDLDKWI